VTPASVWLPLVLGIFGTPTPAPVTAPAPPPAPLACIAKHYVGAAVNRDGAWELALPDGARVDYDREVTDVYELVYKTGAIGPITDPDYDPGRVRLEAVMRATYGDSAAAVQSQLVTVRMRGQAFRVHKRIEAPFRRVAARLDAAARTKEGRGMDRFFVSPGGTFNWRVIAGTKELSMHSWGIAIDLDPSMGHYWRNVPEAQRTWKNRVPQVIVDAFEAEGFIWGGRWYHYDTMHFEYRPELLESGCYPATPARAGVL
jgi:hypothetical protein